MPQPDYTLSASDSPRLTWPAALAPLLDREHVLYRLRRRLLPLKRAAAADVPMVGLRRKDGAPVRYRAALLSFPDRPQFDRWAVRTGSGFRDGLDLVVIDLDAPAAVRAAGLLPPTWGVRTRRGVHLYYRSGARRGESWPRIKGVDVKHHANAFVVAPTMPHRTRTASYRPEAGFGQGEPARLTPAMLRLWAEAAALSARETPRPAPSAAEPPDGPEAAPVAAEHVRPSGRKSPARQRRAALARWHGPDAEPAAAELRDAEIVRLAAGGVASRHLGRAFGLSAAHVRRIVARAKAGGELKGHARKTCAVVQKAPGCIDWYKNGQSSLFNRSSTNPSGEATPPRPSAAPTPP